jgi:hypothetical protein
VGGIEKRETGMALNPVLVRAVQEAVVSVAVAAIQIALSDPKVRKEVMECGCGDHCEANAS